MIITQAGKALCEGGDLKNFSFAFTFQLVIILPLKITTSAPLSQSAC
jgi:enoyl-CoA hydratase/carnithine racemase